MARVMSSMADGSLRIAAEREAYAGSSAPSPV